MTMMTNEQLAILLGNIQLKLKAGIDNAENTFKSEYPQVTNYWGAIKSKAFSDLKKLDNELNIQIQLLAPQFP